MPSGVARLLGAVLAVLATAQPARTQVLYGSIVGNVTDASQAAVPSATVTITHRETGQSRSASTSDTGAYSFATIPSGTYDVQITKDGFRTFRQSDVFVTINNVTRVDATLNVGAVTETVVITAAGAALQTDRAEVRAEIPTQTLENMPIPPGRN